MAEKTINIIEEMLIAHLERIRPPLEIRNKLDIGFSYDGRNIELFTIRPAFHSPSEIIRSSYAKIKYIKSRRIWKLYWMRASGKWESYEPHPSATHLQELLDIVDENAYGCFIA